jgi:phosphotriesterase-related protein
VTSDVAEDVARVRNMKEHGLLHRVLLSHDNGWYEPGNTDRRYKGYGDLFTHLLPALRSAGLSEHEIELLVARNPAEAFAVRARPSVALHR